MSAPVCRHGYTATEWPPCGRCPCQATGGRHNWAEADSGDALGPLGGGRGTRVVTDWRCDDCSAIHPQEQS